MDSDDDGNEAANEVVNISAEEAARIAAEEAARIAISLTCTPLNVSRPSTVKEYTTRVTVFVTD
eukprot:5226875-Pleurochrysis_carterae.AAC.1